MAEFLEEAEECVIPFWSFRLADTREESEEEEEGAECEAYIGPTLPDGKSETQKRTHQLQITVENRPMCMPALSNRVMKLEAKQHEKFNWEEILPLGSRFLNACKTCLAVSD